MGLASKACFVVVGIIAALCYNFYRNYLSPTELPKFDLHEYWGPGDAKSYKENAALRPFEIVFDEQVMNDLKQQLNRHIDFLPSYEGVAFEYGFNAATLKEVIRYWRDDYLPRSKERQAYFNKLNHFKTQIQGLDIHYIHQKAPNSLKKTKKVYPLLILHGWPGSVREFYDLFDHFAKANKDDDFVVEVVAPSLPGFGWSQAASKAGMGPAQMAIVLRNLMLRLGHERFFVQGGDWGSIIASEMSTIFPENIIGYHSNLCMFTTLQANIKAAVSSMFPSYFIEKGFEDFYPPTGQKLEGLIQETGYFHLQATKPDTIGAALSHNPHGLAAYILEKFSTATNKQFRSVKDGGLTTHFTFDALIDNLMVYYFTNSITSSVRIYTEAFTKKYRDLQTQRVVSTVPYGCASFQHDIAHSIDWQIKDKFPNLVHHTYYRDIGHFAAMQAPLVMYNDVLQFIKTTLKTNETKTSKSN